MIYRLLLYLQLLYFQKLETNVIIKIIARIIKSEKGSRFFSILLNIYIGR